MSLSTFIEYKDVKEAFKKEFVKPNLIYKDKILAPPLTSNYSIVGIAFDYLLRFYIKHLNPEAIERTWVSESSVLSLINDNNKLKRAEEIINTSKVLYKKFIEDGKMNNDLLKSILLLSRLDVIYRTKQASVISLNVHDLDKNDLDDLKALFSIINPLIFKSNKICLLNPTFGDASRSIGGADADLIIDDTIIEIKTIKQVRINSDLFNQLVGYYILSHLCKDDPTIQKCTITKIGIYFSRYAFFYRIDLNEIINKNTFPKFIKWFKKRTSVTRKPVFYSGNDLKKLPLKIRNAVNAIIDFKDEEDFRNKAAVKFFNFSITDKAIVLNFQFLPRKKLIEFKRVIKSEGFKISGDEKSPGNIKLLNARYLIETQR